MAPSIRDAAFEALDRRLDPASPAPLAIGFSGGGDSLALLAISASWAQARRRRLWAFTVDHGLHPDSAAWTEAAGRAAARLGATWRALAWTGPKPTAGLPAAARDARHALLADAARKAGARVLLLGHTADDIAESELIRAGTPTHGRLAEWAPSPVWPQGRGVFILRPLLPLHRADLRAWLAAKGLAWFDDPANTDPRFARSRARASLETRSAFTDPASVKIAPSSAGPRSSSLGFWPGSDESAGEGRKSAPFGALDFGLAALLATERPADALAKALLCVSGRSRPSPGAALARLLDRLGGGGAFTATLSGARLGAGDDRVRLTRELGRSPPTPIPLTIDVAQVFDGRFVLVAQASGWRVGPLTGHAAALPKAEREALRATPADARPGLPVLLGPNGETRLPQPFGAGLAHARCLMAQRLAAAWGLVERESLLEWPSAQQDARGAAPALLLS